MPFTFEEKMARPERFELPTTWFEGTDAKNGFLLINKLDGPPSTFLSLTAAESRELPPKCYVIAKHLALVNDVVE